MKKIITLPLETIPVQSLDFANSKFMEFLTANTEPYKVLLPTGESFNVGNIIDPVFTHYQDFIDIFNIVSNNFQTLGHVHRLIIDDDTILIMKDIKDSTFKISFMINGDLSTLQSVNDSNLENFLEKYAKIPYSKDCFNKFIHYLKEQLGTSSISRTPSPLKAKCKERRSGDANHTSPSQTSPSQTSPKTKFKQKLERRKD